MWQHVAFIQRHTVLAQGPVVTPEVSSVLLTISQTDAHGIRYQAVRINNISATRHVRKIVSHEVDLLYDHTHIDSHTPFIKGGHPAN